MELVVASSNVGKLKEIEEYMDGFKITPFDRVIESFEIEESGSTFAQNAMIKAQAVFAKLQDKRKLVISDDSGISLPLLDGAPGIYSARYAGKSAKMEENLAKLIGELKSRGIKRSYAFYTAAIAIVSSEASYCVHGFMHGEVIDELLGDGGFGYDPMFIPKGFEKTVAELPSQIKKEISHRSKALNLAKHVLELFKS